VGETDGDAAIERISIFGLGKLGAPLAACLAARGFFVVGVDVSPNTVDLAASGSSPVDENGLDELIAENATRLSATLDGESACLETQASCIIVPTPSGETGAFMLDYVLEAAAAIGRGIAKKSGYHLVAIVSTVMPGDTQKVVRHLEEVSGKQAGRDFGVCYSPEFIALGSVIRDLTHPDMVLIGELDERAGDKYEGVLRRLVENDPPIMRMNFVNAELSKIAVNGFVTTKITYANMLARICQTIPGADVDVVTEAVGRDTRIGEKYLKGGMAFGGPCFPRDNVALTRIAELGNADASLPKATHLTNRFQNDAILAALRQACPPPARVAVLGLSYKPETAVVEESASLMMLPRLQNAGYTVAGYDPKAYASALEALEGKWEIYDDLAQVTAGADVLLIATPWADLVGLSEKDLSNTNRPLSVLDPWRVLDPDLFGGGITVIGFGRGPVDQASTRARVEA
jgi:UDPglucose 6-dehydrogenase